MTSVCARRGEGEGPALRQASDCAAAGRASCRTRSGPSPFPRRAPDGTGGVSSSRRGEGDVDALSPRRFRADAVPVPRRRPSAEAAPRGAPAGPDGAMARGLGAATSVGAASGPLAMPPKGPVTTPDRRLPRDPLRASGPPVRASASTPTRGVDLRRPARHHRPREATQPPPTRAPDDSKSRPHISRRGGASGGGSDADAGARPARRRLRLQAPDLRGVLPDRPVAGELSHARHVEDCLARPAIRVEEQT